MGKSRRKKRTHVKPDEAAMDAEKIPRSFVIKKGSVGKTVVSLIKDLRTVMEPLTARNLRVHTFLFLFH
jgi:ribosome biogenesis protein SSF1/2